MASDYRLIDLIVVVVYLLISLFIGLFGSRMLGLSSNSEEDYFLAGRRMPGWLNGMSVAASAVNSNVAPVYCGITLVVGLSAGWFFLSRFGLAMLAASLLFAVRWRQLNIRTGPEFLQLRFGRGSKFARIYSSLFSVFIGMIPWTGSGIIGIHLVMGPIFGIESIVTTILIIMPVLTIYVWTSGLAGVLITDALQGGVIILASIAMAVMVLLHFSGPAGLSQTILANAGLENGGRILSVLPAAANPVVSPLSLLAWILIATIGAGGNVGSDGQRLFSCRTPKEAAKVGVWGQVTLFAMLLLIMLPTLGLLAKYPDLFHATPVEREKSYSLMILEFLPPGLIGLTIAALLAAVMSSVSTHLNYGSQTLLNDVCRPLFGEPGPGREVWLGRLLMLLIAGVAVLVALFADSLMGVVVWVVGLTGASVSFAWGQWWHWRVNFKGWCASVLAGPLVYFICGCLLPQIPWWAAQLQQGEAHKQNMAMLQAVVALIINTLLWIVVSACTRPEEMSVLKEFYLRAKPMGFWGPVRAELIAEGRLPDEPVRPLILPGLGVAAIGFVMAAAGTLALSCFYVGRYGLGSGLAAVALATGILFKRLFNIYLAYSTREL